MECVICFEEIHIKDINIMECCKQITHKQCIEKWIKSNINKISDINQCFYCKQSNITTDYIIDLVKVETYNNYELNNDNNNQLNNDNNNQVNNNIIETNIIETNNIIYNNNYYKYKVIIISIIISLVCIIGIIIICFLF